MVAQLVKESPNIIRVIKSRMIIWVRHVAQMRDMRNVYKILVRKLDGKRAMIAQSV
jgi:hypothetical protein